MKAQFFIRATSGNISAFLPWLYFSLLLVYSLLFFLILILSFYFYIFRLPSFILFYISSILSMHFFSFILCIFLFLSLPFYFSLFFCLFLVVFLSHSAPSFLSSFHSTFLSPSIDFFSFLFPQNLSHTLGDECMKINIWLFLFLFCFFKLTVSVDFIDHVLQLGLGGVLSQRAHHRAQLFSRDGAISVLIEQWERLLKLWQINKHNKQTQSGAEFRV